MLKHLTISNFALVHQLDLSFSSAMTVVTGETGAGKSIMLDALGLTLGDRADTNLIAAGAEKAEIHSIFEIDAPGLAADWLSERDLVDDGNAVILRRIITRDGRSRGFINGVPTTVGDLKTFGDLLIDIHTQYEHQSLLKRETHRRLLDEYGNLVEKATELQQVFAKYRACASKLEQLTSGNEEQSARQQLLAYQAEELAELDLQSAETALLEREQKQLANAENTLQQCQQAITLCKSEDDDNLLSWVSKAANLLYRIDDDQLAPIVELLSSSRIQIEEATIDLEHYVQNHDVDPARLQFVETRLGDIYEIARKHRIDPSDIPDLVKKINTELAAFADMGSDIDHLSTDLVSLKNDYQKLATKLGKARRKAAVTLETQVSEKLVELGMAGATFQISLAPIAAGHLSANGLEEIEFLISTNPGQKPGSLNKIASGGELSRISLAIQVVTAHTSRVPTLVFDEVDVGIGGAVAEVVGALLRELGQQAQIICVTHLPQVAAQGHQHLKVTKGSKKNGAIISVAP
ncbi:MAG: DNA repair protein RecN, partial [Proteobacteria bacterium]|nr:DNA repair protein RecN [Pseudomonadota bacterium]